MHFSSSVLLSALVPALVSAGDGLNTRAKAAGRFFGTAVSTTVLGDDAANAVALNPDDFGQYTCENEMKIDATEPSQGTFTFDNADAIVAQAEANGMTMRCHTLVWHSQVPSWMSGGGFDNATLISVMENHIAEVVGHFKGKCYAWDVVNEALNEDGSYRESFWYQTIGPAYVPIAFAAAAKADPDAKLFYNDYNLESGGAKASGALEIVKLVQSYGAPIHGIGFQGHLTAGSVGDASTYVSTFNKFVDLDVEVAVTELDIRVTDSSQFEQQATDFATIVSACTQVPECVGVTVWGVSDKYSWLASGMPLLWDSNFEKKAAYTSALEAWGGAAANNGTEVPSSTPAASAPAVATTSAAVTTSVAVTPAPTTLATVTASAAPISNGTPSTGCSAKRRRNAQRKKRNAGRRVQG